jgi:hypothetical protein
MLSPTTNNYYWMRLTGTADYLPAVYHLVNDVMLKGASHLPLKRLQSNLHLVSAA